MRPRCSGATSPTLALPFPDTPGLQFHDHWLALVALAAGEVAYVDRPLYDYVQHAGAVFGDVTGGPPRPGAHSSAGALARGGRGAYFLRLRPARGLGRGAAGALRRAPDARPSAARCSGSSPPALPARVRLAGRCARCARWPAATRRWAASGELAAGDASGAGRGGRLAGERAAGGAVRRQLPDPLGSSRRRLRRWRRVTDRPRSASAGDGARDRRWSIEARGHRARRSGSREQRSTRSRSASPHPFTRGELPRAARAARRLLRRPPGRVLRHRRAQRLGQEHAAEDHGRASTAPTRAACGWPGGWRRSSSWASASTRS